MNGLQAHVHVQLLTLANLQQALAEVLGNDDGEIVLPHLPRPVHDVADVDHVRGLDESGHGERV
ncbi:hypothetical protein ACFDTO_14480 [Microbacteriaceae bacterium 4G12]